MDFPVLQDVYPQNAQQSDKYCRITATALSGLEKIITFLRKTFQVVAVNQNGHWQKVLIAIMDSLVAKPITGIPILLRTIDSSNNHTAPKKDIIYQRILLTRH